MEPIKGFAGRYRWLSNFWPVKVVLEDVEYPSVENAYQAAKFPKNERAPFTSLSPGDAKRRGRTAVLPINWPAKKIEIMLGLTVQKFQDPDLKEKLRATGDAYIEETNGWGDKFWGVSGGVGQNNLGKIIMKVRSELTK